MEENVKSTVENPYNDNAWWHVAYLVNKNKTKPISKGFNPCFYAKLELYHWHILSFFPLVRFNHSQTQACSWQTQKCYGIVIGLLPLFCVCVHVVVYLLSHVYRVSSHSRSQWRWQPLRMCLCMYALHYSAPPISLQ